VSAFATVLLTLVPALGLSDEITYLVGKAPGVTPTSVNDALLFTGNSGAFAEYRVNACRISFKLPPSENPV
jgi:hypothetical protein